MRNVILKAVQSAKILLSDLFVMGSTFLIENELYYQQI